MHEIMEVTETVIFSSCREYHDFCQTLKYYDFPCFVILQEYLHEYLFFIEYKLQFIVSGTKKLIGTNSVVHTCFVTYSTLSTVLVSSP